MTYHYTQTM